MLENDLHTELNPCSQRLYLTIAFSGTTIITTRICPEGISYVRCVQEKKQNWWYIVFVINIIVNEILLRMVTWFFFMIVTGTGRSYTKNVRGTLLGDFLLSWPLMLIRAQ